MTKRNTFPKPVEFIPKNPDKYVGSYPILMRSSWETSFAKTIDVHPNIIKWGSESIVIEYFNPVKNKKARYYTDFVITFIDINKQTVTEVIEIKPYAEANKAMLLIESQMTGKSTAGIASTARTAKSRAYQDTATVTNAAKWVAAKAYCDKMGYTFKILTEHQLFGRTK